MSERAKLLTRGSVRIWKEIVKFTPKNRGKPSLGQTRYVQIPSLSHNFRDVLALIFFSKDTWQDHKDHGSPV